jgi:crotonobetainyl-CoA:carnitine CoA-transferase CaiB-like acyl-CoA transferase
MGITGPDPDTPQQAGPGIGDIFPGTLCALGVVAALRHAEQTGEGQYVDVAMYDGVLALCERIVYQHSYTGEVPRPRGNSQPNLCPFGVFPAADGHVTIAAPTNNHWRRLCDIIGRPEYGLDERYKNNLVRNEHRAEVEGFIAEWTSARSKAEIVGALGGEVPVGPVNTIADIASDPHVKAREMLADVDHPGTDRLVTIAGTPIKLTRTPGGVRRRAPMFGEHTDDVLREAGYADEQIEKLRADEVIR